MHMMELDQLKDNTYKFIQDHKDDADERQQAQSWIKDFLEKIFNINNRRVNAGFEWRVKTKSYQKYVDHLLNGVLLIEMKSRGKSLDKAKSQAYQYVMKLKEEDIPQYVMLCDFEYIRLFNLDTSQEIQFKVEDLARNIEVFNFLKNKDIKVTTPQSPVNAKAATLLETLHYQLREMNYPRNATELLMTRLVFCMFADSTGIFETNQFYNYILNNTKKDGSDLIDTLGALFTVLNTPLEERYQTDDLKGFRYINGGLFNIPIPTGIKLTSEVRNMLLKIAQLDWSQISPIIFGSMFEGAMNEERRHDLGAHFTSEINIMKVIDSLFLDELNNELDRINNLKINKLKKLQEFHDKLATLKFLDPACGSGNFLMLAYREIRRLEHEIIQRIFLEEWMRNNRGSEELQYQDTFLSIDDLIRVEISQFYGIEIERYAVSIAKVGLWLMDHLMNMEASSRFGQNFARLPLHAGANIFASDALLTDWNVIINARELDYILGNPPFLGAAVMSSEQKDALVKIGSTYKGIKKLDYVAGWYIKAVHMMHKNKNIKAALVSTNSITQGEQAIGLWGVLFKQGIHINFAHRTFCWDNNGANVYVVIVGFSLNNDKKRLLFDYPDIKGEPLKREVEFINEYLLGTKPVNLTKRTTQISGYPTLEKGSQPTDGGHLILNKQEKESLLKKYLFLKDYIRPFIGSRELIHNEERYILRLRGLSPNLLRKSPEVLQRVELVRKTRLDSKSKQTVIWADRPTELQHDRVVDTDILIIPSVSSERREYIPMAYVEYPAMASNLAFQLSNADLFIFGILQTKMHTIWLKTVGGRLKSDYRYSNTLVYNNFVFPKVSKDDKDKVISLSEHILDIRNHYFSIGNTIADLYDPFAMPHDLRKSHVELNAYVEKLYRKKPFIDDIERAEFLISIYTKQAKSL